MGELLGALLMATAIAVVLTAAGAALLWAHLRRRVRVAPCPGLRPPARWLASPSAVARLHRRLRALVLVAHAAPAPLRRARRRRWAQHEERSVQLALDIELQALALDRQLLLAARLPWRARRALLWPLAAQVADLEQLAARLAAGACSPVGVVHGDGERVTDALARLDLELTALEAARDEIARLEASYGLDLSARRSERP